MAMDMNRKEIKVGDYVIYYWSGDPRNPSDYKGVVEKIEGDIVHFKPKDKVSMFNTHEPWNLRVEKPKPSIPGLDKEEVDWEKHKAFCRGGFGATKDN